MILTDMQKHLFTLDDNYKNESVPIQRSGSVLVQSWFVLYF